MVGQDRRCDLGIRRLLRRRAADLRAHDTHHAIPNSNYGQYIMLLDFLMGTYRLHPQDPGSVEERRREAEGPSGAARGDAADGNARPTRALGAGRAKQM